MYLYKAILTLNLLFGHIKCQISDEDIGTTFESTIHNNRDPQALNFRNEEHFSSPLDDVNDLNNTLEDNKRIINNENRYPSTTTLKSVYYGFTTEAPNCTNDTTQAVATDTTQSVSILTPASPRGRSSNLEPTILSQYCAHSKGEREIYCEHKNIPQGLPPTLNISSNIIPKNATFIRFKDFESLHIEPGTFKDQMLKLVKIEFINIPNIVLEENSLSFDSRTERESIITLLHFENCSFTDIKKGTIDQIGIKNYKESNEINLHNVRLLSLHFKRCHIRAIRTGAIAKARIFSCDISDSKIDVMENESIDIDAYENFKIDRSNITSLVTNSINIRSTHTVVFSNNDIGEIQTRAFRIQSENQVKLSHNTIQMLRKEAFSDIRPWHKEEAASIILLGNNIIKAEPLSLLINKNYPAHEKNVQDNRFNINCGCNVTDPFEKFLGINENSTYIQNATFMTILDKSFCLKTESSSAQIEPDSTLIESRSTYINIKEYINTNCSELDLAVIISSSIASFLLLLIIVVCIVCHIRVKRAQEEANYLGEVCSTRSYSVTHVLPPPISPNYERPLVYEEPMEFSPQLFLQDAKTYQQIEVNIPYENAEPMRASIRDSYFSQDSVVDYHAIQQNRASCPFN